MSTKKNSVLVKIRDEDGAQCYRTGPRLNDIEWLCGSDRAQKVTLGDKGDLVYTSGGSRGRWVFNAYDNEC